MKRASCAAAALFLVVASSGQAIGVDATADPDKPSVIITEERVVIPDSPRPGGTIDSSSGNPPTISPAECDFENGELGGCVGVAIAASDSDPVLPAEIERAVRELGLPALTIQIQPGRQTLVNVPTIFYTEPADVRRTVTLLGQSVDVEATPANYRWHHGDGTSSTTTGPGRPYPATDVTHTYQRAADGLRPSVDVTYRVRYRINGGTWQDLSSTITAAGPAATLRVTEAPPVLVHP